MKRILLTPSAGKRLIGKAMAIHPAIKNTLKGGTIVIIAGTTNSYIVDEIFANLETNVYVTPRRFFRGITLPPFYKTTEAGRLSEENKFPGDVVIRDSIWQQGKTIFDVADDLKEGDIILKGANALDPINKRAAILIGHQQGGTITTALQAVVGRRVRLILPVGLEKRVYASLDELATKLNTAEVEGPRLLPVPGEVFTEIDALSLLTGVDAELFAAGGVCGAEGSLWLIVRGTSKQEAQTEETVKSLANEPAFSL